MPSKEDIDLEDQRKKIIGLGDLSIRKSYFPELQQQQEALKESEARLRSILHGLPVMQFVIDYNHRVISWNKAMETYSGYKASDMVGTDDQWRPFFHEKRPVLADILLDESRTLLEEYYPKIYRRSKLVEGGYEATDFFPHIGESGKWLHVTAVAIKDDKGKIIGAIETLEDITERKKAVDALKENEKFLSTVFDNIPEPLAIKDVQTLKFLQLNKAGEDLFGVKREELVGKTSYDLFNKEMADTLTESDQLAIENNLSLNVSEEKVITRFKGERTLLTKKIIIPNETGNPQYLLKISEDVTERRRMENALMVARNKLSLLNTIIFQDIQNAAFTITAYTDLLKNIVNETKSKDFLEKQGVLNRKILESLDFAKAYQDMGAKPPRWQNVNMIFLFAISHLDFLHLTHDVETDGLEIYADPMLERVFFNLMQNVIKYGVSATKVTIRYEERPDNLILIVQDDGVGIPPEEKQLIFNRGYGKDGGLGLFLVREILSITGITILENGETGKGARFEITVPKSGYRFTQDRRLVQCQDTKITSS